MGAGELRVAWSMRHRGTAGRLFEWVGLLVDQPDDEVEQDSEDYADEDHADERDVTAKTPVRAGVANIAGQAAELIEEWDFARQPDQAT